VRSMICLLVAACAVACSPSSPRPAGQAVVVTVIDGDTVDVEIGGRRERLRLIGIDTPETKDPDQPVECFGPEASAALTQWLPPGTVVMLTRDTEARDAYGRLLVYLRREDGLDVNVELARQGFADVLSIEPNTTRADEIAAAVEQARSGGLGMWSACPAG
jgi:micrococcal nuclease